LLASASLFVLASQADSEGGSDNLPTVLAEAIFAGVPCVSTTMAGIPEMITSGGDGLLVSPKDAGQLADAMQQLLEDREFSQRLAKAGHESARAKFSIENTVGELRRLLQEKAITRPTLGESIGSWWRPRPNS